MLFLLSYNQSYQYMYYIMYNFVLFVDIKQHFDYIIEKMLDDIVLIHLMMEYRQSFD